MVNSLHWELDGGFNHNNDTPTYFLKFILTAGEREWIVVWVKKEWKLSTRTVQARADSDFD